MAIFRGIIFWSISEPHKYFLGPKSRLVSSLLDGPRHGLYRNSDTFKWMVRKISNQRPTEVQEAILHMHLIVPSSDVNLGWVQKTVEQFPC